MLTTPDADADQDFEASQITMHGVIDCPAHMIKHEMRALLGTIQH